MFDILSKPEPLRANGIPQDSAWEIANLSRMPDVAAELSGAKRRIIERLKRADSATAPELAGEFGLTDTAIRQHLEALEAAELVERVSAPSSGRGRPPTHWRLTAAAGTLFADRHADLTVELISSIRAALGDDALDQVVRTRAERQLASYQGALDRRHLRRREGAPARPVAQRGGLPGRGHREPTGTSNSSSTTAPSAVRPTAVPGLCSAELEVFQIALGSDVAVEREQHLLDGGQRCAYRITPR